MKVCDKVSFISEVSSNHNKDLNRCLSFIEKSAEIGCSSVKFQLFKVNELFAPEVISRRKDVAGRKEWELPLSFLPKLHEHCKTHNIEFACTPFYIKAVAELFPFVDYYKIASYELLWGELLKECARTGKPVVLSTGMATLEEVKKAVGTLKEESCRELVLLHCNSSYPAPPERCNLAAIKTLKNAFALPVGWSDHTANPGIIYRAVHRWKADMVEFHLDIDGKGKEFGAMHCWLPEEMQPVIENIKIGFSGDGDGVKKPAESEEYERNWRADPSDGMRPLVGLRNNCENI